MILDEMMFPKERALKIAEKEKRMRKYHKMSQKELSMRSGVSLGSLKRFEQTGEISFVSLLKIADVLEENDSFDQLFERKEYRSIEEVLHEYDS